MQLIWIPHPYNKSYLRYEHQPIKISLSHLPLQVPTPNSQGLAGTLPLGVGGASRGLAEHCRHLPLNCKKRGEGSQLQSSWAGRDHRGCAASGLRVIGRTGSRRPQRDSRSVWLHKKGAQELPTLRFPQRPSGHLHRRIHLNKLNARWLLQEPRRLRHDLLRERQDLKARPVLKIIEVLSVLEIRWFGGHWWWWF